MQHQCVIIVVTVFFITNDVQNNWDTGVLYLFKVERSFCKLLLIGNWVLELKWGEENSEQL